MLIITTNNQQQQLAIIQPRAQSLPFIPIPSIPSFKRKQPTAKMQFTTVVLAALSFTGASLAAPAAEVQALNKEAGVAASKQPLIDVWESPQFLDLKFTGSAEPGDCVDFQKAWNDRVQSGKAKPGFRCTVWFDKKCQGQPSFSFNSSPGSSRFPDEVRKKGSSWKCVAA